jgi:type 1 glutamine amidotransferase
MEFTNMKKLWIFAALCALAAGPLLAADKKIVLIAGAGSHGTGSHEHLAGCKLFQKCLAGIPGVQVEVAKGWPESPAVLAEAAAVVIYADGEGAHPALRKERLQTLADSVRRGAGFACLHYAVAAPKNQGGPEFRQWMGGYYETHWSVNPTWEADFKALPDHPVARGVKPFKILDEWYYHMRFVDGLQGVVPILSAHPPRDTLSRPDGPHEGNPAVRRAIQNGEIQPVMWVHENADGQRGFGFTGGHFHANWANENFRKAVLNAILWIAKVEVPPQGVDCPVTLAEVNALCENK